MKQRYLFLLILISPCVINSAWSVDTDGDGSDAVEEALAGTSDNDPNQRPYWWKTFNGDSGGIYFGEAVSGAGDVNNDGHGDLIVGFRYDNNRGSNSGLARVYSGFDGGVLYTVFGNSAGDFLGHSVSGAGDVNNDGYDDFIVGAPFDDNNSVDSGSVYIYSGVNGSVIYTVYGDNADQGLGYTVSDIGDIDNDGYGDFIAGAPFDNNGDGMVRVYSGRDGSVRYTKYGFSDSYYEGMGRSVSGAGDINNDGYVDFIVGSPYYGDGPICYSNSPCRGVAQVFSGRDGGLLFYKYGDKFNYGSIRHGDHFGFSVDSIGDINNDDYDDIIIASRLDEYNRPYGAIEAYSGQNGNLLYRVSGNGTDDLGYGAMGQVGDVNNDGYIDFIVGSPGGGYNGANSGSIFVYSGLDGSELYRVFGDNAGDRFGSSVSGAGDVDGDGYSDLIIGAPEDDNNGNNTGSVRVILSSDLMNDRDRDYWVNSVDAFPDDPTEWQDADNDGIGNNADWDDDNDGVPDTVDAAPLDDTNSIETDLPLDGDYKGQLRTEQ